MNSADYIVAAVILLVVLLAAFYVVRAKKRGVKCIGCPSGGCSGHDKSGNSCSCTSGCASCCGCGEEERQSEQTEHEPEE